MSWVDQFILGGLLIAIIKCLRKILHELMLIKIYTQSIDAPTVEAIKHGRWIPVRSSDAFGGDFVTWQAHGDPIAYHYCSECKEQSRCDEFGDELLTKYCPDCGAKMDGEEE